MIAKQVEYLLTCSQLRANNEIDSSHILRLLTGDFLEDLNSFAPVELSLQSLEASMDLARNPSSFTVSALVPPNKTRLYANSSLIIKFNE